MKLLTRYKLRTLGRFSNSMGHRSRSESPVLFYCYDNSHSMATPKSLTQLCLKRCIEAEPNNTSKLQCLDEAAEAGIATDVINAVKRDEVRLVTMYQLSFHRMRKVNTLLLNEQDALTRMLNTLDECYKECIRLLKEDIQLPQTPQYHNEDFSSRVRCLYNSQPDTSNYAWTYRIYLHLLVIDLDDNIVSTKIHNVAHY